MSESSLRNLKNEDFRKLLSTPAVSDTSSTVPSTREAAPAHSFTHRKPTIPKSLDKNKSKKFRPPREKTAVESDNIFDEAQARLNEVLSKYRDRAAERRKGMIPEDDDLRSRLVAAYKAVPGTLSAMTSAAEKRKLEIQESKYLGGDIEHTHLVRGLDYSLLNKVRGEIEIGEKDKELEEALEAERKANEPAMRQANSKLAKNICQILFENKHPMRNELFVRGRMAYLVELDDEIDVDVPSTLLRSVNQCPTDNSNESINTDNVLINKLTQVLAYLRADTKKRKRPGERDEIPPTAANEKIYEDVGDYAPKRDSLKKAGSDDRREKDQTRSEKRSYFDSKTTPENSKDDKYGDNSRYYDRAAAKRDARDDYNRENRKRPQRMLEDESRKREYDQQQQQQTDRNGEENLDAIKKRRLEQEDAYAEFYPGGVGLLDAGGESDDEADYTKMDMGNRKGPVKRWDFDNQDDFERYQDSREAMPKAAYQFGVKMNAGRKTRKNTAAAHEKKIDRELQKINKILDRRQQGGNSSGTRGGAGTDGHGNKIKY